MIAVDTNVLVYAHRSSEPRHQAARTALDRLSFATGGWAIPWPCVHEFVAVVTRPSSGVRATPVAIAFDALDAWLSHPGCRVIGESGSHLDLWRALVERAGVTGGAVHDARIAAICLGHGVTELWTCDRDFARFPDLRTRDPLVPSLHEPTVTGYQVVSTSAPTPPPATAFRAPSKRITPSSAISAPIVRRSSR
jgi:toxin-antitoxin system PIN domain toxin